MQLEDESFAARVTSLLVCVSVPTSSSEFLSCLSFLALARTNLRHVSGIDCGSNAHRPRCKAELALVVALRRTAAGLRLLTSKLARRNRKPGACLLGLLLQKKECQQ